MELKELKRDSKKIEAGVWIGDLPGFDDVRFKVRGLSSPSVLNYQARRNRAIPRRDREPDGSLKPEAALRVLRETLLEIVLLDWDGITENGEPVPYSKERAEELLTDPDYVSFADAVTIAARAVDQGDIEAQEELEGNSSRRSRGRSNTEQASPQA